jgi:serine/threonine protein kinase
LKKLGKYEVLGELGHGAMGVVYRARDPFINRLVALKTITTGLADDPALLERFYREAQSAGGLQHPNIVTIYDMGDAGSIPYIAMELIEGENLEQVIARKTPLPTYLKLLYALQACRAFDYAHKRGIVHRDIKPGNVMVSKDGSVKVVDFGIARVLETSKTQTGMLIGTFAYMSPEQYHGEHADERSDIWSFGVMFYEMLAYQKPFTGATPASLMHSICQHEPALLSTHLPGCPLDIQTIMSRLLQKSPAERYQTMEDVLLELEPVCKNLQSEAVAELVERSYQLAEKGEFTEARDLLRQALQVESGNHKARTLLERVNSELKRLQLRPRVEQAIEQGRAFLNEGKVQEAKAAADSALQLESTYEPALELQRAIQQQLERALRVAEWLGSAKQRVVEGQLDEAAALAEKALQEEPANKQAGTLLQQIREEKADRQRRERLQGGLQRARDLWTQQQFPESIQLLGELCKEFPGDDEVSRLLETVREDQVEQQKRQALFEVRNLLTARRYEECLALLTQLQKQFPRDEEIPRLLDDARADQRNQRKMQALADAKNALAAEQYDQCTALLTSLAKEFPEEPEIPQLLEAVRQNREERARQQGIAEVRKLLSAHRYDDCLSALKTLQGQFPKDQETAQLFDQVRADQTELRRQEGLAQARKLLGSRDYEKLFAFLGSLQKDFPDESEIRHLWKSGQDQQAEQRKQDGLEQARKLLGSRDYEKLLSLLTSLQKEFPDEQEIRRLQDAARDQQAEQRKQEGLSQARKLLDSRDYEKLLALLASLQSEFPDESEIRRLQKSAQDQQAEQQKQKGLGQARKLLASRDYQRLAAFLSSLQREFPDETEIRRLQKSAQDQQAEQRKREGLVQARNLLSSRSYDESIALLTQLQTEFPNESEIGKLLANAREDHTEQLKEADLAKARALLASQSFDESLTLLSRLAEEHPKDGAVLKLRTMVKREQEKHVRTVRVERELDALKKLMAGKKYSEVLAKAKQLLVEFPGESNFVRMAEFAGAQQETLEKEDLLRTTIDEVKSLLAANKFEEAARASQAGLTHFPSNLELRNLDQQAENQRRKLQIRQQIEQRVREIRVKINREKFSEAIDLAQQTLVTLGPDTNLSQLLNSAQVEWQAREKKRKEEQSLETIRTLVDSGDFDGADRTLQSVVDAKTLETFDPRVERLAEHIKDARQKSKQAPTEAVPTIPPSVSREYALLQAAPSPTLPPAPTSEKPAAPKAVTSKSSVTQPTIAPTIVPVVPPKIEVPPAAPPVQASPTVQASAPIVIEPPKQAPTQDIPLDVPVPRVEPPKPERRAPEVRPAPSPIAPPASRKLVIGAAAAVGLALVIWAGVHTLGSKPQSQGPPAAAEPSKPAAPRIDPLEVQQRGAINEADKLVASNDLEGARKKLHEAAATNGPLSADIAKKQSAIEESLKNASLRELRQREETLWQQAMNQTSQGRYPQAEQDLRRIVALPAGGIRKDDAQNHLDKVIPQRIQQDHLSAQARQSLAQGDFRSARQASDQFRNAGGDTSRLVADIDQAEKTRLTTLEGLVNQLKTSDDDAAVQQLKALQPKLQAVASANGPQASEASTYANSIPDAISDIQGRAQKNKADAAFQQLVQRYQQAASSSEKNGIQAARNEFQSLVQSGGPHASDAQTYLSDANSKLAVLNQPPPAVSAPPVAPPVKTAPPVVATVDNDTPIRGVIQRYMQAYDQRDANALRQVWPSMGSRYGKLRSSFEAASSIQMQVDVSSVEVSADGTTAVVKGQTSTDYTPKGGKAMHASNGAIFHLSKTSGTWVITDVQ